MYYKLRLILQFDLLHQKNADLNFLLTLLLYKIVSAKLTLANKRENNVSHYIKQKYRPVLYQVSIKYFIDTAYTKKGAKRRFCSEAEFTDVFKKCVVVPVHS